MPANPAILPHPEASGRPLSYSSSAPTPTHELLIVETEPVAAGYAAVLRHTYRVATTTDTGVAVQYLKRAAPALVVAEIDGHDGDGSTDVCRAAKSLQTPATVLVTTADPKHVPDAIDAGCDAVLLKPFAPNLLYARIGRLLRARSEQLRVRAWQDDVKSSLASTNRPWPDGDCPQCNHRGVVSFEFASYRRAWYACLACKSVWMAKRLE
jgi:CheY-like chemotaxis protein